MLPSQRFVSHCDLRLVGILRPCFSGIRIHVPFRGPIVLSRGIGRRSHMRSNVGAALARIASDMNRRGVATVSAVPCEQVGGSLRPNPRGMASARRTQAAIAAFISSFGTASAFSPMPGAAPLPLRIDDIRLAGHFVAREANLSALSVSRTGEKKERCRDEQKPDVSHSLSPRLSSYLKTPQKTSSHV